MSFNFKKYVRELLIEQSRVDMSGSGSSVDTSNYKEDPPGSGEYRSTTGKDPYAYSIVSQNTNKIVIKIKDAPSNRRSAIGKTFKITKKNLDNPNVQLLYSSLVSLGAITNRLTGDEDSLKTGSKTAEVIIIGDDFDSMSYFKEQHDKIKSLGHELSASTLTQVKPPSELKDMTSDNYAFSVPTVAKKIEVIVSGIEKYSDVQVVSMTIEPRGQRVALLRYMAKKDDINYIHSEFSTKDTPEFIGELFVIINDDNREIPSEDITIKIDDSAIETLTFQKSEDEPRETFQALQGESEPGTMPSEADACINGYKVSQIIDFENAIKLGERAQLEGFSTFCPSGEEGTYELDGIKYEIATQGKDYDRKDYSMPVFKTKESR
jgi:hypothetical protein